MKIDLTPRETTKLIPPVTFFNHLEEVILGEEDIKILEQVTRLFNLIPEGIYREQVGTMCISAKILKIRILRRIRPNIELRLAKDIVEYLDSIFHATSENNRG